MMRLLLVASLAILTSFSAFAGIAKQQLPWIYYVTLPVQTELGTVQVNGQYRLPRTVGNEPIPAVVILHSTGGVDSTGAFYAKALNRAGIATLELDMWSPRGFLGGAASRPQTPQQTIPDAYAALKYLAERKEIDENKIGVMGFSWGGVITLLSATEQYNALMNHTGYQFAAHVAHYPVCYLYNNPEVPLPGFDFSHITAPVLIQSGTLDDYDLPFMCPLMVNQLSAPDTAMVELNMYPFAYHAWDRLEPKLVVEDHFSHLGQGGKVTLKPSPFLAKVARHKVLEHFKKAFE